MSNDTTKVVNLSEILKAAFPDPSDNSRRANAARAAHRARYEAHQRVHAERLQALREMGDPFDPHHEDNCGGRCRIDLDGHDCCGVCNEAEDRTVAWLSKKV